MAFRGPKPKHAGPSSLALTAADSLEPPAKPELLRLPFRILGLVLQDLGQTLSHGETLSEPEMSALLMMTDRAQQLIASASGPNGSNAQEAATAEQNSLHKSVDEAEGWLPEQRLLIKLFKDLDVDASGSISTDELRSALIAAEVPRARLTKLFQLVDADNSGEIDLAEWTCAIAKSAEGESEMRRVSQKLMDSEFSTHRSEKSASSHRFMIHPRSKIRVVWDVWCFVLLSYVATVQMFTLAWTEDMSAASNNTFTFLDYMIDYMFLFDVGLNFRTGYFNTEGELIMDWRRVGLHYLRTWCLLDVASSIPFEAFQTSAAKLPKISRIAKVTKMLKRRCFSCEDFSYSLDDWLNSKWLRTGVRRFEVLLWLAFLCHWLACGMKLVDSGWLSRDSNGASDVVWHEYLAAMYWGMTTLTTVGYGDITPKSDGERVYTLFAMLVGGCFYGYAVGSITRMVAKRDINESTYYDRMDHIHAWMIHHGLPRNLKRRLRRYFAAFLHERSAITEAEVWFDLSPELQKAVGHHIIHDDVKWNPLFDGMPMGEVVRVQTILRTVTVPAGQMITTSGEAGTAMYILVSGSVWLEAESVGQKVTNSLGPGQSFGEEILLGLAEDYAYSTTVTEDAKLHQMLEDDFHHLFRNMPNAVDRMRRNVLELHPQFKKQLDPFHTMQPSPLWRL